jgi:hypothetical protein
MAEPDWGALTRDAFLEFLHQKLDNPMDRERYLRDPAFHAQAFDEVTLRTQSWLTESKLAWERGEPFEMDPEQAPTQELVEFDRIELHEVLSVNPVDE